MKCVPRLFVDYPGLNNPELIEALRRDIIHTFKAYITAKLGTPNNRLQTLFQQMIQIRRLGFLHYRMTKTRNLLAEECTKSQTTTTTTTCDQLLVDTDTTELPACGEDCEGGGEGWGGGEDEPSYVYTSTTG